MSHDEHNRLDRAELDDLLVRQATVGLDADETTRLNRLLTRYPDVDAEWAEQIVGELDAASLTEAAREPIPADLRAALLDAAPSEPEIAPVRTSSPMAWSGWLAAAAIAGLWWMGPMTPSQPSDGASDWAAAVVAQGEVVAAWEPGGDATGDQMSGEVVWSNSLQGGVLRLAGLTPNSPDEFQYQLWIFDATRDDRYPVDGGVFDIPSGDGVVEIPVRPTVPVGSPTLFAVTVERPGGVVVSDRSRIASLAQVGED